MKPKKRYTKLQAYEDALINIAKLHGECWDGDRLCHDPGAVAHKVIEKHNPALAKHLDTLRYNLIRACKNGKIVIPRRRVRTIRP